MAYDDIGKDAVSKYKFRLGVKIFAVLLAILGGVITYFYLKPTSAVSNLIKIIFGFFKR